MSIKIQAKKTVLHRLQDKGFKLAIKRSFPLLDLYRKVDVEEAQRALESDPSAQVKLKKRSESVVISSIESAEVLDSVLNLDPKVSLYGLKKMSLPARERTLASLKERTADERKENLLRIAQNTIVPGDWRGQLAQLLTRPETGFVKEASARLQGRIPSTEELGTLEQKASELDIEFAYLVDGCYARSHLLCGLLREEGINSQKIFVEGSLGIPEAQSELVDGKIEKADVKWYYHTAPLVLVETEDKLGVESRVWDPSMAEFRRDSSAWYSPEDWVAGFDAGGEHRVTVAADSRFGRGKHKKNTFNDNLQRARNDVNLYNQKARELTKGF